MSNFQDELIEDYGYQNIVVIAVGQSNLNNFNTGFCFNSNLPFVMDQYPDFPIRAQFEAEHRQVIILDPNGNLIGDIVLNAGLTDEAKNYFRSIIDEYYAGSSILGDINEDTFVNVQDVVLLVGLVVDGLYEISGDLNSDNFTNVLDIVQIVNIIISN